jgi:hypothetical protein
MILAALGSTFMVTPASAAPHGFVEPVTVVYTLEDPTPGEEGFFGWEVTPLSDIDGDGVSELIVSEPYTETGTVYVYSGRDGEPIYRLPGAESDLQGFSIADVGDIDRDGTADFLAGGLQRDRFRGIVRLYSGATGELLGSIPGVERGDQFGYDASGLGDVNGDGVPDFAASAVLAGGAGRVYVYSGKTHDPIRTLEGENDLDQFGSGVGVVDDIDRDGVDDLVVGARHAGARDHGEVYVYSGRTGVRVLESPAPPSGLDFGWFFTTGIGDVNRDGVSDIYVSDHTDTTLGPRTGRATIVSGRDGSHLRSFPGSKHHEGLGPGRGAGDVDGDGVPDVVAGSFMSSDGRSEAGQLEIYSGADGSLLRRITSTREGEQLGFDALGFEDITGDGVPELVGSAAGGDAVYLIEGISP